MKKKILSLLVLLMAAVSGAWTQQKYNVTFSGFDDASCNTTFTDVTLPYSKSFGKTDACSSAYDIDGFSDNAQLVEASFGGDNFTITVISAFEGTVTVHVGGYNEMFDPYSRDITVACVPAAPPFDYTFSVADCDHGTGKVQFFIEGNAEPVTGANVGDEGKTVYMIIMPDAGWIVDATKVKAESYSTWEAAGAPSRRGAPNITILGDITLTFAGTDTETGARAYSFTMPASSVLVSTGYQKISTLYFEPAGKTNLIKVEKDGTTVTPTDGKLTKVLEGTAIKLKANTGYKFRKVNVKKGKPTPVALNLSSPAVGQVIGSDGKNYDYASLPSGVTAVARICYVSGNNGLALALTDEGRTDWTTAGTLCADHIPEFTVGEWKLATQDEWNDMINAAGNYNALRDSFSGVGGRNLIPAYYWSSTDNGAKGFIHEFGEGGWYSNNKSESNYVRACFAF